MVASFTSCVYTGHVLQSVILVVASFTTGQVLDGVMLVVASSPILVYILDIKITTFLCSDTMQVYWWHLPQLQSSLDIASHLYCFSQPFFLCTHSNLLILCMVHKCMCLIAYVHYIDTKFNTSAYKKQTMCAWLVL